MTERRTLPLGRSRTLRGRPELYTDYRADMAILNTSAKRWWTLLLLGVAVLAPFLLERDSTARWTNVFVFAIGALGLNLLTGYGGQVSLGHAFFVGLGAFTAAWAGTDATASLRGLGLDMWLWLPLAGLVPAIVGFVVAPLAVRVRGLYLAILTLGLVFIGEHLFREATTFTGGFGVGRRAATPSLFGIDLTRSQTILGFEFQRGVLYYLFCLANLVVFAILTRNLARSKLGRSFSAVRDRDIAAEIMGVPLLRTKVLAFTISSFYAGICGALLGSQIGQIEGSSFGLIMSVYFLAMILIGGPATVSGSIVGAAFVVWLPRIVQEIAHYIPLVTSSNQAGNALLTVFQLEIILFGGFIIAFLVLEPRGLFGLWLRVRNYFKAWPFSY
jgi:branched-chain amino acid transport system permease protein